MKKYMPTEEVPYEYLNAVRIPANSETVLDADEEVFILYSELQKRASNNCEKPRGLGHVDSRQNVLTVTIELKGGDIPNDSSENDAKTGRKRAKNKFKRQARRIEDRTIEVDLIQDTTALRSRRGDTGSVLWHASVDFARFVLQQAHIKSPLSIFDIEKLRNQHVFELGAGTGVLSLLFSPLCRRYTVTDIPDLLPLIQKNIALNFPSGSIANLPTIHAQSFDWVSLKNTPPHRRQALFPIEDPIDVLLIVDCIYHPSLLAPLVETIDYLTTPGQTIVMVVSELRSEQVIREFLELWLAVPRWIIKRSPSDMLSGPYVMWIGYKEVEDCVGTA